MSDLARVNEHSRPIQFFLRNQCFAFGSVYIRVRCHVASAKPISVDNLMRVVQRHIGTDSAVITLRRQGCSAAQ